VFCAEFTAELFWSLTRDEVMVFGHILVSCPEWKTRNGQSAAALVQDSEGVIRRGRMSSKIALLSERTPESDHDQFDSRNTGFLGQQTGRSDSYALLFVSKLEVQLREICEEMLRDVVLPGLNSQWLMWGAIGELRIRKRDCDLEAENGSVLDLQ
jgi:hypothetical protein